jgi:outer membrane immunogenic protein
VSDDDVTVGATTVNVEHEYDAAVYAVGILPISPNFELFARGGYGTTEIKASAAGVSASDSGESWNYGVGANYFIDGRNGIRADWTRRDFTNDGGEADVWSLGYVRKF